MLSFDDLIPQNGQKANTQVSGLSFDDLVPKKSTNPFTDALSDIGRNIKENEYNNATQTGAAMSEPMNSPGMQDWSQHPVMGPLDAAVRGIGKAGNALGGAFGAATSIPQGALTASVENSGVLPAAASAIKNNLVPNDPRFRSNISPDQQHQIAQGIGGDLTNATMLGMGGVQGEAALRARQGLPAAPAPYNPVPNIINKVEAASQKLPGILGNTRGAPESAPPSYSPKEMFSKAGEYYDSADAQKAVIGAPKIQSSANEIGSALAQSGYDADFHPQTAKWLDKFSKISNDGNGQPIDLPWSKVNGMRKLLNGVINDSMKQGGTEDGYQAIVARNALDKSTGSIQPNDLTSGNPDAIKLTQQANALWSAASKSEDIQDILDKGQNAAVPATSYKNGFNKLINSPKFDTYTPEEQAAIQQAAKTGIVTGALKTVGSRLLSGIVGTAAGSAAAGPFGAPVGFLAGEAAAYPFRSAANALQRGKGANVQDIISQRPAVKTGMENSSISDSGLQNENAKSFLSDKSGSFGGNNLIQTPEFKKSFGNSKVVDEQGNPLVVYHGTNQDFNVINTEGQGARKGAGAFFSNSPNIAGTYTSSANGGNIRPAYLNMENPLTVDMKGQNWSKISGKTQVSTKNGEVRADSIINKFDMTSNDVAKWAKENGYDGVIFKNSQDRGPHYNDNSPTKNSDVYTVFKPEQVISTMAKSPADFGSASMAIPAAMSGAALGAQQMLSSKNKNQNTPSPLALANQPMSTGIQNNKPVNSFQSSLPDISSFAKAESSNNPNAKNPNSSASGLFQFTNKTWADMVQKYGKQTGIDLGDKNNPQAQATMAQLYAKDNIASLQGTIGRMPTKGELYMAHLLGATGAAKLINADPQKEAIMLYPKQVLDANRAIFFDGKRPKTVSEVYQTIDKKVS